MTQPFHEQKNNQVSEQTNEQSSNKTNEQMNRQFGEGEQQTLIIAHRGSKGTHPENTMVAFLEALEVGAEGIELDVHLSKDGIPVVIHDETLERTTNGKGWVKDYTVEELKCFEASAEFGAEHKEATIPTLEETLEWLASTQLLLNIELKNGLLPYPTMEEKIVELVNKYSLEERIIFSSFNHYSLVKLHQLQPEIETAILFMEGLYEPWNYAKSIGAKGLHCYLPVAQPLLLQRAREEGTPVRPFTVNEEAHIRALIQGGSSAIITDFPEKALQIRRSLA
ncbi:glycerophosphodiester phosphodiesterase [Bacillus horti]|uniref:Glycerophosphoryl diester phosphodiesterase n=1 Tax=Caldalkalibacillus horti TaxID=77523 RepID=A0ABT9VZ76_9BACI|nr:glycerophosphodiester phosphodiesterase [Bacillus horti]MDQ0166296.1 glycerophosphoryl diester phosphodiesterase [Bacillus horti]